MSGIARRVGVPNDRVEQFVRESPWEYAALQEHLVVNIPDAMRDAKAVLVVDDVGFLKKGKHSVGVHRQYTGASGKIDNCQAAVDLVLARPGAQRNADQCTWPLGMALYLPQEWLSDDEKRGAVGVPKTVDFQTKPQIALGMIDRARTHGVQHACTVADAGYGDSTEFRAQLRAWSEPYIVGITPSKLRFIDASTPLEIPKNARGRAGGRYERERYPVSVRPQSAAQLAKTAVWEEVAWAEGTKGTLTCQFYRCKVRVTKDTKLRYVTDEECWLLLEKRGNELKAHLCWRLDDATLQELVVLAHMRWTIEQFHRDAKQELALDDFEGRTWKGWHHHVSMVLLAYAFIATLRAEDDAQERPPFSHIVRLLVHEAATQTLVEKQGLDRRTARKYAADVLRSVTEWG